MEMVSCKEPRILLSQLLLYKWLSPTIAISMGSLPLDNREQLVKEGQRQQVSLILEPRLLCQKIQMERLKSSQSTPREEYIAKLVSFSTEILII